MTRSAPPPAPIVETDMSKNIDIVALLEYMDRIRKPAHHPKKFHFSHKLTKDTDIISLIKRKKEEAEALEKFLKDSKKEDKKPDKMRTFTNLEWFIIGILLYPVVGPLYQSAMTALHNLPVVK